MKNKISKTHSVHFRLTENRLSKSWTFALQLYVRAIKISIKVHKPIKICISLSDCIACVLDYTVYTIPAVTEQDETHSVCYVYSLPVSRKINLVLVISCTRMFNTLGNLGHILESFLPRDAMLARY